MYIGPKMMFKLLLWARYNALLIGNRNVSFPQHSSRLIDLLATLKADCPQTTRLQTFSLQPNLGLWLIRVVLCWRLLRWL